MSKGKSIKFITYMAYKRFFLFILLALLTIIFMFPLVFTVTNSFMNENEIIHNYSVKVEGINDEGEVSKEFLKLKLIPQEVTFKQYYSVLVSNIQFLLMFWNSVFLTFPVILGQIIVASMAAYAFAKIKFRFREKIFFLYIVTMLMPFQVTLVPNYIVADRFGLIGSFFSIIFPGIFGTFGVFLLRQFMLYIPNEYIEAAKVDGASHFQSFIKIILPMSKASIAALSILVFIDNWNMVEQPIIFLQKVEKYPLSIFLSDIGRGAMGIAFAASAIYMFPMILVFLYGENYLVQGIQLSGIKG